ncbi:MAG: alpha/beta hydrolase [Flavobacteriales bacterium]|nr:alpha/beta hydrolase [Flavobacteriales bacterium]
MKFTLAIIAPLLLFSSCLENQNENPKYLFFLHNRFLESHHLDDSHPEYGRVEYLKIIESFENVGFHVISEKREGNVNAREYALGIVQQIDSLISIGIEPSSISVVGTSKGGYIAQYVSTLARNENLNFVFVASFQENDIQNIPEINYCGNIMTIYERSDPFGVSAVKRFNTSTCTISHSREIELNTGLGHGFLFKAIPEWINPTIKWASGNY